MLSKMIILTRPIALLAVILLIGQLQAQPPKRLPLHNSVLEDYAPYLHAKGTRYHTAFKPYLKSHADTLLPKEGIDRGIAWTGKRESFWEKAHYRLGYGHWLSYENEDFQITADPLLNLGGGFDKEAERLPFSNYRGILVKGSIRENFAFRTGIFQNVARFPAYLNEYVEENRVVPGQGRLRPDLGENIRDFGRSFGSLSWRPADIFGVELGHGKQFIGDGYRSLLLSDHAFNYPYLKLTTDLGPFQYTNLYTEFQDLGRDGGFGTGFGKKYGAFHYLSWNISETVQLGFFEGVIWQNRDSTHQRGFDYQYLNPIIFYRPLEYSMGSPDNVIMGLNGKINISDKSHFYGQFVLDDFDVTHSMKRNDLTFHRNKIGFQLGFRTFSPFSIDGLSLRMEYNKARPYTYAHKVTTQNYTHYQEPLAHPFGANFREGILKLRYRAKRWILSGKTVVANYGSDTGSSHFGKDIFTSDFEIPDFPDSYDNPTGQGVKTTLQHHRIKLGYVVNPTIPMVLEAHYTYRNEDKTGFPQKETHWVGIGLRTTIFNRYYDF